LSRPFSVLRLALALCLALVAGLPARAADKLRLGVQASGTFGWEIAVARSHGLDRQADLDLETVELATTDAGKIALAGGGADLILSDWLWAARERSLGTDMLFYPHSTALGAVMAQKSTKDGGAFARPADFVGKKLGVAGGPLDKSWLMLQAWALRQGVDLKARADIVFAAPPLLAEKLGQGELDAALEFWPYAARLQAQGFARVVDMAEVERDLGAKGPVIVTGYVFRDSFAARNGPALARFFDMMTKAKSLIADDDAAFAEIAPKVAAIAGSSDPATLALFRQYYRQGIPTRPLADDIADADAIFGVLAKIGGPKLVGSAEKLDRSVFYSPGGDARKP
jgi:NitT/TauT family transport system substrate-binding protein